MSASELMTNPSQTAPEPKEEKTSYAREISPKKDGSIGGGAQSRQESAKILATKKRKIRQGSTIRLLRVRGCWVDLDERRHLSKPWVAVWGTALNYGTGER